MKRFTETGKWLDTWYKRLEPRLKLLYQYILDTCDHSGVFEFDPETASTLIGMPVENKDLHRFGDDRIAHLRGEKWVVVKFIRFQFGELSVQCRPHKVVFDAIKKNGLKYPTEYPIQAVSGTAQDKDKEKDQDKDGKGSAEGKDNLPTSDRAKRIAAMFNRRLTTPWSDKEIAAYKKLSKQSDEDFDLVEMFYQSGYEFLRHDLGTFLNNFTGEVDKARKWKAGKLNGHGTNHRPATTGSRVIGTANEGTAAQYRGIGQTPRAGEGDEGDGWTDS